MKFILLKQFVQKEKIASGFNNLSILPQVFDNLSILLQVFSTGPFLLIF